MQASLFRELQSRRSSIRSRWEALLRAEPVSTPLALPDALVHMIDQTLDEVLLTLEFSPPASPSVPFLTEANGVPSCACGRNPFLAYFAAAEQALREGLILAQASCAPLDPVDRDSSLEELNHVLAQISRREIEAFCGVCQFRHLALLAPVQPLAIGGG